MTEVNSILKDELSLFQVPYISVVNYDWKTMNQTDFFFFYHRTSQSHECSNVCCESLREGSSI